MLDKMGKRSGEDKQTRSKETSYMYENALVFGCLVTSES